MKYKSYNYDGTYTIEETDFMSWVFEEKGWRFVLIYFLLFCFLNWIFWGFVPIHYEVSNGEHTGIITATETNGIIFKTSNVYFKTDTESTQEDIYCVIDKSILQNLRQYQENKQKITLIFVDYYNIPMYECGSFVDGVIIGVKGG